MSVGSIPVLHEASTDIPIVEVRHVFRSGAASEPEGLEGIGRLALRLLRRGAAGRGRREMDEAIDRIAAIVSAQASPDFYGIHLRVLTRYLERASDLLADLLLEPTLDGGELDRLKRETIAEIVSSRDDDRHLASRALRLRLFDGHPYGRSSIGTVESVERVSRRDVLDFLESHLTRGNLLVAAAGDIGEPELRALVGRTAERLPSSPPPAFDAGAPTTPPGRRLVVVDKPERTQVQMLVGHVGPHPLDPHDLALRLALTAFGGTFTSRLMREVRVERGWSYGAYASLGRARQPDALSLWTFPSVDDAAPCLELVLRLYGELRRDGPPPEDVAFARDFMARSFALQKDTAPARLTLKLRELLLGLPAGYYDTYTDRVRAVTDEQARAAVEAFVQTDDLVVSVAGTADGLVGRLRAVLGDGTEVEVIPYDSPIL